VVDLVSFICQTMQTAHPDNPSTDQSRLYPFGRSYWFRRETGPPVELAYLGPDGLIPGDLLPGGGEDRESPGEHQYGDLVDYSETGRVTPASEIQYCRVWLSGGVILDRIRVYISSGGAVGRNLRVGIYNQTTPLSDSEPPNAKVAESASTSTNGLGPGYVDISLTAPYSVPTAGYYWVAFISDSTAVQWLMTVTLPADSQVVRREAGASVTLPVTASGLSNPRSAVVYSSMVEQ
jgi:hypothetical protein